MLRVLALLCCLALLLAPSGVAQAGPGCAMAIAAQAHAVHGPDQPMPTSGHPATGCKQLCAVLAVLIPRDATSCRPAGARPLILRVARLTASQHPAPGERPPKGLV